jgi:hypothetical protein
MNRCATPVTDNLLEMVFDDINPADIAAAVSNPPLL